MGYMRHHAIIVTGPNWAPDGKPTIHDARERCVGIAHNHASQVHDTPGLGVHISEVTPVAWENNASFGNFFVAPDGSKEGWPESDAGDTAREEIVTYLRSLCFSDGSTLFKWVEVQFADDQNETKIIRDSDHPQGSA